MVQSLTDVTSTLTEGASDLMPQTIWYCQPLESVQRVLFWHANEASVDASEVGALKFGVSLVLLAMYAVPLFGDVTSLEMLGFVAMLVYVMLSLGLVSKMVEPFNSAVTVALLNEASVSVEMFESVLEVASDVVLYPVSLKSTAGKAILMEAALVGVDTVGTVYKRSELFPLRISDEDAAGELVAPMPKST
ncbi:hypothetical protein BAUCODRAFT_405571 [Baudoinia panamericana UAMH 10762]|uniref:Uncharacterized protein n=1 Tax=Baudoinia panamericana (strain UAMH 10762) TaxID=717646 RepID=M2NEZ7_BAUPA|nr:uncharacterized protein BAUCODRAFT_405571 [Baudoinia panamericana UAMH 10762]EMC97834.1 hypothetical protein BAUCODRAFT_405571 [Baudoinia panamericana UAMH 10762]